MIKYDQLSFNYKDLFLLNSDYNTDNGLGFISTLYLTDIGATGFLRGGDRGYGTSAGVLYLGASSTPSYTTGSDGFRCVVAPE